LETLLPLCLRLSQQNILSLSDVIAKITHAPANILGLNTGTLSVGAQADICIFDENEDWQLSVDTINSHGKNSPFLGWNFQGKVKSCIIDGKQLYSD